jgi:hypothetical protein
MTEDQFIICFLCVIVAVSSMGIITSYNVVNDMCIDRIMCGNYIYEFKPDAKDRHTYRPCKFLQCTLPDKHLDTSNISMDKKYACRFYEETRYVFGKDGAKCIPSRSHKYLVQKRNVLPLFIFSSLFLCVSSVALVISFKCGYLKWKKTL